MKLLIIDNHGMFMEGFAASLKQFEDVEEVFTFFPHEMEKIKSCIKVNNLDLLLIDINLDGISGFDYAEKLIKEFDSLPVAFITGHGNQANLRSEAEEYNAIGFFLKDPKPNELLQQIKRALKGEKPGLGLSVELPKLTPREKELLHYLCEGYTNQELAEQLYISMKQVERHKRNLMIKFNVSNDKTLVRHAIDLGYEIIE